MRSKNSSIFDFQASVYEKTSKQTSVKSYFLNSESLGERLLVESLPNIVSIRFDFDTS